MCCPRPLHPPVGGTAAVRGVVLPQDGEQVCPLPAALLAPDPPHRCPGGPSRAHGAPAPGGMAFPCPGQMLSSGMDPSAVRVGPCVAQEASSTWRCALYVFPLLQCRSNLQRFQSLPLPFLSVNGQCLNGFENAREILEKKGWVVCRECQRVKRSGNAHT